MTIRKAQILILCKTYPSPSAKHAETSCVAGLEIDGRMIRLYPVPFRLIGHAQFKKWQWITALVEQAKDDRRPESHRIKVDTISVDGRPLSTRNYWAGRRPFIDRMPLFHDFAALEAARKKNGITLALLRPRRITGLDITAAKTLDWSKEERSKLLQLQQQSNMFDATDATSIAMLRKLPFDFHYRYECDGAFGSISYRHKIVDWETGALYWNVYQRHKSDWEPVFREKLEQQLPTRDLMLLMGTIHRFPDQWLIISLIYPPVRPDAQLRPRQQLLL